MEPSPVSSSAPDPQRLDAPCAAGTPNDFVVEPRNGNAYLSWTEVDSANVYEVEIYEIASGELVAGRTLRETRWEWGAPGFGQGPFRARVRARTDCGFGNWSADDLFILNRSGSAAVSAIEDVPTAVPVPPAAPAPPAPAKPLLSCGTLNGEHVVNLLETVFYEGLPPVSVPLTIAAGTYRVEVETNDANHTAGRQTEQTSETVTIRGVGTTTDIPEAAVRQVTTFTVTLPALKEIVIEAGPHSVHGVCLALTAS